MVRALLAKVDIPSYPNNVRKGPLADSSQVSFLCCYWAAQFSIAEMGVPRLFVQLFFRLFPRF